MLKRLSKCLTVDPSVLLAAGESEHPVSSACRRVLLEIRTVCHRIIETESIRHEWEVRPVERGKRPTVFSRTWRASMVARKKLLRVTVQPDAELRTAIARMDLSDIDRTTIEEDLHLIEAAMANDRIILSLDDRVRRRLQRICRDMGLIRRLIWVNPCEDLDVVLAWLREGAPPEPSRRLGFEEPEET